MFRSLLRLTSDADGFLAPRSPDQGERMFGGQFLAQCLTAAQTTVGEERDVHSLHAYFLRPGSTASPVRMAVETVRDGRSYSSRQVIARQDGKERFRLLASFQAPEESPEYAAAAMPDAPPPEAVAYTYADYAKAQTGASSWHGADRTMDIRYVNPPQAPRGSPVVEPQLMWMRIDEELPDEPRVHRAALAYLSDSTLVDHVPLPHGRRWQDPGFDGASIDHAMWFHRPARADRWLLFAQTVEATGGGRGLASGRLFARSGALVASCAQEGLMRWHSPSTTAGI